MDTDIDLDPHEQRRRDAAERLTDLREEMASDMLTWLEQRRDRGDWSGSLKHAQELAQKMADAALRLWLPEAEVPSATIPHYFDLPKDTPQ